MLNITRKVGQRIFIMVGDDEIIVTVNMVRKGGVNLGITSPKHIKIYREEVVQRMERELEGATDANGA